MSVRIDFFSPQAFTLALLLASLLPSLPCRSEPRTVPSPARTDIQTRPLSVPPTGRTGFTRILPAASGIAFTNHLPDSLAAKNRILENGSGVAAGDIDGDGLCDLYFCRLDGPNALYRNLGQWRFEPVPNAGGAACANQYSTGAVLADVDGDGDLDLLVGGIGVGVRLFANDGRGAFADATAHSGLQQKLAAHTLALADVDDDGDLDLYVVNYRTTTLKDESTAQSFKLRRVGNRLTVPPEWQGQIEVMETDGGMSLVEFGEPDSLYLNDGQGRFTALSWTEGAFTDEHGRALTAPYRDWGLAVMFRDFNGDRAPDLYICNDLFSPDRVWMNDGRGRFRALPALAMRKSTWASMAVDFADLDRDGYDEFFVIDMLSRRHVSRHVQRGNFELDPIPWWGWPHNSRAVDSRPQVMRNTLFLNRGDAEYAEIGQLAGVHASEWSWGAVFLDVDLDGYEDLLIANGHAHDVNHLDAGRGQLAASGTDPAARSTLAFPRLQAANVAFRNNRDLTFTDASAAWSFDEFGISNGMALADLDNDGDQDVILNNLNSAASLYRNDSSAPRIAVRLRGRAPNTQGIGAQVRLCGPKLAQSQQIISGGRYLSGDDPTRTFAALDATATVEVVWRDGARTRIDAARPNHAYFIAQAATTPQSPDSPAADRPGATAQSPAPWFEDVSAKLNVTHHEIEFDDMARQPLLPRKLSQNGPGLAWIDLNGDQREDLVLASGAGRPLAVLLNDGQGGFKPVSAGALAQPAPGDQTSVLGWLHEPGSTRLLIAVSGYESARPLTNTVTGYSVSFEGIQPAFALDATSHAGPVAAADLDNDGDLDLFIGGQALPARYPAAARSVLYRQTDGRFAEDAENTARLAGVGLINGAVWSDLNGDGSADLLLACEWGPVRVFLNTRGALREATTELGLDAFVGWWNGVATGDFDGDGRLDLVASNWGRNTKYQEFIGDGLRLYHGDLDGDGTWESIEAYYDRELRKEVPWRDYRLMGRAVPSILDTFSTYAAYGAASVQEIFGDRLAKTTRLTANTLDSMLFLNRAARFEARPLPLMAQLTPAFAACIADFDGDGREDIFLSQNFFAVDRETGRYDAGRGLLLRGDGAGQLNAVPAPQSGLRIYGEQRAAAAADYDGDGRIDLAVTQNAAPLMLFKNRTAAPGLRVRLAGPIGNLDGIGAQLRLKYGAELGPVREVQAGSGYWSQNSAVVVLGRAKPPTGLWVRWPGGKTTEVQLPAGAAEVEVSSAGELRVIR